MSKKLIIQNPRGDIQLSKVLIAGGSNVVKQSDVDEKEKKILESYGCTFPAKIAQDKENKELAKVVKNLKDDLAKKDQEIEKLNKQIEVLTKPVN